MVTRDELAHLVSEDGDVSTEVTGAAITMESNGRIVRWLITDQEYATAWIDLRSAAKQVLRRGNSAESLLAEKVMEALETFEHDRGRMRLRGESLLIDPD